MAGSSKEIIKLLQSGELFINNASKPEVQLLLAQQGIDNGRLAEGDGLLVAAKTAVQISHETFAQQLQATDTLKAALDVSWAESNDLAKVMAAILKGQTESLALLGLHKRRDETTGESELAWPKRKALAFYVDWARNLYFEIQKAPLDATAAARGYSAARLAAMADRVEEVSKANEGQELAKARAAQATVDRDTAVAAFKAWYDPQKLQAKIALKEHPRLLILLGLKK